MQPQCFEQDQVFDAGRNDATKARIGVQPQCVEQDQVFDAGRNDAWRRWG